MFEEMGSLRETIELEAGDLAGIRISELTMSMIEHPELYPDYHEACEHVRQTEAALREALAAQNPLLEAYQEARNLRDSYELSRAYELGVMDGGRIYHALVTHELPKQLTEKRGDAT